MSISEQIKELRDKADVFERSGCAVDGIVKAFREAADTIEALSQKLALATPKRPLKYEEHEDYDEGICPICGEPVCHVYSYCPGCGQRLKWGSSTEESEVANMERLAEDCSGGWILCSDRTPDEDGLYIIHVVTGTGENDVGTCLYQRGTHLSGKQIYIDDKQGYWASPYNGDPVNEYLTQNVIAWQPLPEPYHQ